MSNPMIPLCRSIDTDRLYRSNTGSAKLLRCLMTAYNELNLGCFVPSFPIWTEGNSYQVGEIIFGRGENEQGMVYCLHIWECKIAHTATEADRPVDVTTLKWRKIGSTPTWEGVIAYPPCSILSNPDGDYGGLNRSPTGILVSLGGVNQTTNCTEDPAYYGWHHDYNGVYCMHVWDMYGADGSNWYQAGLCDDDLQWSLQFQTPLGHGHCDTGQRNFSVRQLKQTITDNWWYWTHLFCDSRETVQCETSYTLSNLFPEPPDPFPPSGSPERQAWYDQLAPAKACCCPDYESYEWPTQSGWGGQLSFLGFCDYLSVGYDTFEVSYINNGTAAFCRWRFALWGAVDGVSTKRVILKDNIACDFFRYDFLGSDWDIFQGCTLTPLTPDADGFFEYTVAVPDGTTVSDFGLTNINAYNWKYKFRTDILGSVWTG